MAKLIQIISDGLVRESRKIWVPHLVHGIQKIPSQLKTKRIIYKLLMYINLSF